MSAAPSPSSTRGEIVLQPAYFTSSLFVRAARADIDRLVQQYAQHYAHDRNRPFALFTHIWQTQGWPWIQFRVFDARSRAVFLRVVMRLFSERVGVGEAPLNRAVALFGLYTLFDTQPSTSAPPLYSVVQVDVTCDLYQEIVTLPDALDGEFLCAIRPHVVYVQSKLLQRHVFQILPHAAMHPLSPRALPREAVVTAATQTRKKRGRPSKRDRTRDARDSLVALEGWCEEEEGAGPSGTRGRYAVAKSALVDAVGGDEGWAGAAGAVGERLATLGPEQ